MGGEGGADGVERGGMGGVEMVRSGGWTVRGGQRGCGGGGARPDEDNTDLIGGDEGG